MNKFIKVILMVLMGTTVSCDPTLIEEPSPATTENDYFSTTAEFRNILTGAYAGLITYYHFGNNYSPSLWLLPGDDLTESNGIRTAEELFDGNLNPNNSRIRFTYETSYKIINRSNIIIEKVNTVDYTDYEEADEVTLMEGEALFLRAYAYFKLFNIYGSVPILLDRPQEEANVHTPKTPASEVLDQAISDAREALEILPESWNSSLAGRATKNSARGLLVKALVYRGNYTGNQADYTEAIQIFNNITADLEPNFIDNFNAFTENNMESLFEVQAGKPWAVNNLNLVNDGPWRAVENLSVFRGYMMQPSDPGEFNVGADTRFLITEKLLEGFGEDPRLGVFLNPEDGFDGRIFQKYNLPAGVNEITVGGGGGSVNNERVLRYADVMLLAAEAYLKTGNPGEAIELINEVRTRAREWAAAAGYGDGIVPENYSTAQSNEDTIMQWIMDERFVELAGEGHRYWDLKRWHVAGDISLAGWDGSQEHFSTDLSSPVQFDVNKHLVFPLPQAEVERNNAISENNPGY